MNLPAASYFVFQIHLHAKALRPEGKSESVQVPLLTNDSYSSLVASSHGLVWTCFNIFERLWRCVSANIGRVDLVVLAARDCFEPRWVFKIRGTWDLVDCVIRRTRLCEDVSDHHLRGTVSKLKAFLLNVVAHEVVFYADMLRSLMLAWVLRDGNCTLVVTVDCDGSLGKPQFFEQFRVPNNSLTTSDSAKYSASAVDRATIDCFLDLAEIHAPPNMTTKPLIDFRSSLFANSASQYPSPT